jgi:hypothetical protein
MPDVTGRRLPGLFPVPPLSDTFEHHELCRLFEEFLSELPGGGYCLDLAVGTSAATRALRAAGSRRGVVLEVDMIDVCEPISEEPIPSANAGRVLPPAVPRRTYDGVLSVFGFEVLEPTLALPWLRQILAPGGVVSCLSLALEAPMVRECLDYIRVFDTVLPPWWAETRGEHSSMNGAEVEEGTLRAIELLKRETHRKPIRDAFSCVMQQLNKIAADDPNERTENWRRLHRHTELLRARMARAVDAGTIRQFVRDLECTGGFQDVCVIPFELYGWLFGWNWTAVRS